MVDVMVVMVVSVVLMEVVGSDGDGRVSGGC